MLTNEKLFVNKKLVSNPNKKYKIIDDYFKDTVYQACKQMKKFEFSPHFNMLNIIFSFVYNDEYLVYLTEYIDMKEWVTLEDYLIKNKKLVMYCEF